jgi:c-di-GMP-binding flagellar brake protein YcgR
MQEQRRFVRLAPSSIEVRYTVSGQEAGGALQVAKDISEGGIRFPVSEQVLKGARLDLELQLPGEPASIQAQAEVVWCARFQGNGPYEIGCRFTQIDPLDRGKLIRHIHEALKQRKAFTS